MDFDLSIFDNFHTESNIFDGQDIYDSNGMVGHTEPNIFGGQDFHSADGNIFISSKPNIFGGFDIDPLQTNYMENIPDFKI